MGGEGDDGRGRRRWWLATASPGCYLRPCLPSPPLLFRQPFVEGPPHQPTQPTQHSSAARPLACSCGISTGLSVMGGRTSDASACSPASCAGVLLPAPLRSISPRPLLLLVEDDAGGAAQGAGWEERSGTQAGPRLRATRRAASWCPQGRGGPRRGAPTLLLLGGGYVADTTKRERRCLLGGQHWGRTGVCAVACGSVLLLAEAGTMRCRLGRGWVFVCRQGRSADVCRCVWDPRCAA